MAQVQASGFVQALGIIAFVALIAGYIAETSGYDVALGAFLFSVGFWIIAVPIIGILVIFGITVAIKKAKAKSKGE